ncbi:Lysophospholipase L1 [Methylobacterium sp. 190mf]|nr:Lysophospholipase L1 [Methylobacterium sp. 190mf]
MSFPGGRRGILAASSAAVLMPLAVGALVPTGFQLPATPAASANAARSAAPGPMPPGSASVVSVRFQADAGAADHDGLRIRTRRRGVSILQIGDSHTAADLFADAVRQVLWRKFGTGGIGYLSVGTPHPGVRSNLLKVSGSSGWRYEGIQRSAHTDVFGLSGFNASTSSEGETLSFVGSNPEPYARVELEVRIGPDAGSIIVEIDDEPRLKASLAATKPGTRVIEIPAPAGGGTFRKLVLRTGEAKPVTVSALGVFREGRGVTYSSVGFPGATIDVLGRFAEAVLRDDLGRLAPDIVVLAFGTNEGFDAKLDPVAYRERYLSAIREIRAALPKARIVMIGPPQGERPLPTCKPAEGQPCPPPTPAVDHPAPADGEGACPQRPAQLDKVRAVQRRIAEAERIPFWDWWAIMPGGCGASRWAAADPALMAKDHVHFTKAGYRKGGEAFAAFIEPEVRAAFRGEDAVSND